MPRACLRFTVRHEHGKTGSRSTHRGTPKNQVERYGCDSTLPLRKSKTPGKNLQLLGESAPKTNDRVKYGRHFRTPAGCSLPGITRSSNERRRSSGSPFPVNAKPIKGLAYHLVDTDVPDVPRVEWEGEVDATIRTALKPQSKRFAEWAAAETWLIEKLTNKRVWVKDLEAMARKDGIGWTTIIKASRRMGVKKDKPTGKKGFKCHWTFVRKERKKST